MALEELVQIFLGDDAVVVRVNLCKLIADLDELLGVEDGGALELVETHSLEELGDFGKLLLLALLGPLELGRHDLDNLGGGLNGGVHVEEGQAETACNHVDGSAGVLVSDRVENLGVNVRVAGDDLVAQDGPAFVGGTRQERNLVGLVAIGVGQVLGDERLETVLLDQREVESGRVVVCTDDERRLGQCGAFGGQLEGKKERIRKKSSAVAFAYIAGLDGSVDGIEGHGAVCGPLAARDRDQVRFGHVHDVIASEVLCVCLVRV